MDVLLVVVVGRLDERDAVAGDAVLVHERADADGVRAEVGAELPSCAGDMIIPARSASCAVSGEYGVFRWITTVYLPDAVTVSIGAISLARTEPFRVWSARASSRRPPR